MTARSITVFPRLFRFCNVPGMTLTHEVVNQAPPLTGFSAADDPALLAALRRAGAGWGEPEVRELGALAGTEEVQEQSRMVEEQPPRLRTHDRFGHRIDEVEFHPAWHQLMAVAVERGLHAAPWADDRPGAHLVRAAKFYVWSQAEPGHGCPISMTYAAVPALRAEPDLAAQYEPLLASRTYDYGLRPPLAKSGLIAGMSMTEKQGGSDVRANTTRAVPAGDGTYRITGHKWFTSAPMSDVFLVLAQTAEGLSCFLLPRVLPDGTRNGMRLMRLKDKLGNRSNASSEIEYEDAVAWPVGEPGRGVRTIVEMVNMTRLDCVIGSAAGMRAGLRQALHHTAYRHAFGRALAEQPLMRAVLADLAIESEAATTLAMRLATAVDGAQAGDAGEAALRRLALAVGKYWVCKRGSAHAAEALECLGGNGYVEESGMPRIYREAPCCRSGRARATSPHWTCCARSPRNRPRWKRTSRRWTRRRAPTGGWTRPSRGYARRSARSATRTRRSVRPARWRSGWRSRSRAPCSYSTVTRRSRTRSVPPASTGSGGTPSGPCPPRPT